MNLGVPLKETTCWMVEFIPSFPEHQQGIPFCFLLVFLEILTERGSRISRSFKFERGLAGTTPQLTLDEWSVSHVRGNPLLWEHLDS